MSSPERLDAYIQIVSKLISGLGYSMQDRKIMRNLKNSFILHMTHIFLLNCQRIWPIISTR